MDFIIGLIFLFMFLAVAVWIGSCLLSLLVAIPIMIISVIVTLFNRVFKKERDKVCNHKFDFGLGGKGSKTSRHCGKCDQWEDIPNEKKS